MKADNMIKALKYQINAVYCKQIIAKGGII